LKVRASAPQYVTGMNVVHKERQGCGSTEPLGGDGRMQRELTQPELHARLICSVFVA